MAEETQYTSKNGLETISTANSGLDGSGTLATLITGGSNGTMIKSVYIQAQTNTSEGMIRFFIADGTNTRLLNEVYVPAVTKAADDPAFAKRMDLNFCLAAGYSLKVSTENADTFGFVVQAVDWAYYNSTVRTDTTEYTCINGAATISVANSNLDGTGTLALLYQYNNGKGISIESITFKATGNTTPGMLRVFLQNAVGSKTVLFQEIPVPATTPSRKLPAFEYVLDFEDDFELQDDYKIYASTENGEVFKAFVVAQARTYLP